MVQPQASMSQSKRGTLFEHGLTSTPAVDAHKQGGEQMGVPLSFWYGATSPEAKKVVLCTCLRHDAKFVWKGDKRRPVGAMMVQPDNFSLKEDKPLGWPMQVCVFEKFMHAHKLREQALAASIAASSEAVLGGSPVQTREQQQESTTPASRKRRLADDCSDSPGPSSFTTKKTPSPTQGGSTKSSFFTPESGSSTPNMSPPTRKEREDGVISCGHSHPSMKKTHSKVWGFFSIVASECGVQEEGKQKGTPFWVFQCNICKDGKGKLRVSSVFAFGLFRVWFHN